MYSLIDKKMDSFLNEDVAKLILRVSISILMMFHGVAKVTHGVDKIAEKLVISGLPEFIAYGVYIGEILLPILIIIGLFTRFASIGIVITMIFAIYLVYADKIFMLNNHGAPVIESALLYLIFSIVVFFVGAGKYSLDEKLKK